MVAMERAGIAYVKWFAIVSESAASAANAGLPPASFHTLQLV